MSDRNRLSRSLIVSLLSSLKRKTPQAELGGVMFCFFTAALSTAPNNGGGSAKLN